MSDNDDKFAEYALKTLDDKTARMLATEIANSTQKQASLREIEDALTLLAESEQPIAPSAQLRARVLNALRQETRFSGFIERLCGFFDLPRETVETQLSLLDRVHAESWQMNAFPGTHLLHFDGGAQIAPNADCGLVYVEPGNRIDAHRHLGDEWSLVLQGELRETGGAIYFPGDCLYRRAGSVHAVESVGSDALIFAAILIEGLEFAGE
ncbi:MAG: cupin domain-containing protein [Burkholderiales bacterium]|nr:cupin domain-containing protein [Burkholderiales bacterium]MDR4516891.1 cupin domain-containing protein [Nitrosomonas sp.]